MTTAQFEKDRMALIEQIVRQRHRHNISYEEVINVVKICYDKPMEE